MGTDKRNRQKENRRARQSELEKQIQRQKVVRRGVRIAVLVGVVVIIVAAINLWPDGDESQTQDTTETSVTETLETTPAPAPAGPFEYGQGECAPADGSGEQIQKFTAAPKLCIDLAKTYSALVSTNKGDLTIVLDPAKAPGTVNNFVNLARSKYFDGTVCHRAIPSFVVQCGDPTATGSGGPGYSIGDELPAAGEYKLGSLAMANSGPNTNGSQFFIISGEQGMTLQPNYSLFGQVTQGLDTTLSALDKAGNSDPASNGVPPNEELRILKVTISES
ncbi:MAG: peptidylprolyl isomerase [Actinomycetota bacterium]|nr:peptidylprolyl isomerase [Actinomycetota bacterium]